MDKPCELPGLITQPQLEALRSAIENASYHGYGCIAFGTDPWNTSAMAQTQAKALEKFDELVGYLKQQLV